MMRALPTTKRIILGISRPVSLESRSNRRLFDIWHIQIILGEELDETGSDGGGIPARQVVARTRYRHCVDFWNPAAAATGLVEFVTKNDLDMPGVE
jgi:hypothetical protein